jgi:hypothetical protein
MRKISLEKAKHIQQLRRTGHSYPEIRRIAECGYATALRYCKNVIVLPEYRKQLREKQGGSKLRAARNWDNALVHVKRELRKITKRDKLFILAALYWGEGRKSGDFGVINGDPNLLSVFVECLISSGVSQSDLMFSLRVFTGQSKGKCISFWAKQFGISKNRLHIGEVVAGNGTNKLPHGMCRIRIRKGGPYFKRIMSMIHYISANISPL